MKAPRIFKIFERMLWLWMLAKPEKLFMGETMKLLKVLACLAVVASLSACANKLETSVNPSIVVENKEVESIAVTGPGATMASSAFAEAGYKVIDLGAGSADPFDKAKELKVPYIATVDPIDSEGSWWDGFFSFAMRVSETLGRQVVWAATADYGQSGIFINQSKSTKAAMHDMVEDFSKTFPPKKTE